MSETLPKSDLSSRLSTVAVALRRPTSWVLLGLGFSAALPFLLVGGTLGFWLRSSGISLTMIGYLSWITLFYGLKIVWAPWMDKVRLPLLYRLLGQRRSYMLLAQVGLSIGLTAMALIGPKHLWPFIVATLFVTFCAASQEIAVDAWRVEQTNSDTDQALNPSFYSFGFKTGIVLSQSLVLILSARAGWPLTYVIMAALIGIGMATTCLAQRSEIEIDARPAATSIKGLLFDPFVSFWAEHKGTAGLILLTLAFYRLPDYLIGPVVGPMYQDSGLDQAAIGAMRGTIGLTAAYAGVFIGGSCLLIFGLQRAFFLGALVGPLSNLCFSWLSVAKGSLLIFGFTLVMDDLGDGIAETAFVAFLTRMTGRDHTLTHYALMYSVAALTGKLLKGFSGAIVDGLTPLCGPFGAYQVFFFGTAIMALPCMILCWCLRQKGVFSTR